MKKLLLLLLLIFLAVASVPAYGQTTNNFAVVLTTNQMASLTTAWQYDNQLRTNGLAPYTNTLPAQTFVQFASGISSQALEEKTLILDAKREAEMLALWRKASPLKKRQAFMILQ